MLRATFTAAVGRSEDRADRAPGAMAPTAYFRSSETS